MVSVAGVVAAGQGAPQPVERRLDNGARAVLWPRPGSGTVLVTIAVPAGSQDEAPEKAGLSHYLEHLLFDGFDEFDERGVTEAFEAHAAYVNAFTRSQASVFFALAPVAEAEETAGLLVGMLTRSHISPASFAKEKKVILEELAKDQANPASVEEQLLRELLWRGTPLAHPVGGDPETIEAIDREEVLEYWKQHYAPHSWNILITGDDSLAGLEAILEAMTPQSDTPALETRSDSIDWDGWGRFSAAPKPVTTGSAMPAMGGMGHGHGSGGGDPDGGTWELAIAVIDGVARPEMEILARWLGGDSGPLSDALVPRLATSVSANLAPRDPRDILEIRVQARADVDRQQLLSELFGALDAAARGPEDIEVMRIIEAWEAERVLTGQRLHYAAVFYGEDLATARGSLVDHLAPEGLSASAIRNVARAVLNDDPDRRRAAWLGPGPPVASAPLPEAVPMAIPVQSDLFVEGPFSSRVAILPNGMVVGILPETGNSVFGIHLLVADRSLREGEAGIADYMHRLLGAGTGLRGSRDLQARLSRAGIDFKAADSPMIPFDDRYHVPDFSYLRMEGPSASLETALEILAEMIRLPDWDDEGVTQATMVHRQERLADNRGQAVVNQRVFAAFLGAEHPFAGPVSGAAGQIPDIETVRALWGNYPDGYFASDRLILTVASPLPAARTLAIVQGLFGVGAPRQPARGPYPDIQPAKAESSDAGASQATMLWGRRIEVAAEDRATCLVAADALSDRMVAVIREREGLAYRLGAGVRWLPDGSWLILARVGTRPENEDRVSELMAGILDDLASAPLPLAEVQRLSARDRRTRMLRNLAAASRAYRLGRALFEGESSPLVIPGEERAEVTPEAIQEFCASSLGIDDFRLVVAR